MYCLGYSTLIDLTNVSIMIIHDNEICFVFFFWSLKSGPFSSVWSIKLPGLLTNLFLVENFPFMKLQASPTIMSSYAYWNCDQSHQQGSCKVFHSTHTNCSGCSMHLGDCGDHGHGQQPGEWRAPHPDLPFSRSHHCKDVHVLASIFNNKPVLLNKNDIGMHYTTDFFTRICSNSNLGWAIFHLKLLYMLV